MAAFQGALINWFGHRVGYRNFECLKDNSRNTLPIDVFLLGDLLQHNHHHQPRELNCAVRIFEFDIIFALIWILNKISVIGIKPGDRNSRFT